MPTKHLIFDIVGTIVSFHPFYTSLHQILSPVLHPLGISPQLFGYTWQTAAELEFTFLSISDSYTPYTTVLRGVFYRTLHLCGVENPREVVSEAQREECVNAYSRLEVREGVKEAIEFARGEGWKVWGFTSATPERVLGYFERAGIDMPASSIISCDDLGVAKPALKAYQAVWERFAKDDEKWFAAAHMWDVSAATKVGFRGAWCSVLEGEGCGEVYVEGKLNVVVDGGVLEMVKKVVEKSGP